MVRKSRASASSSCGGGDLLDLVAELGEQLRGALDGGDRLGVGVGVDRRRGGVADPQRPGPLADLLGERRRGRRPLVARAAGRGPMIASSRARAVAHRARDARPGSPSRTSPRRSAVRRARRRGWSSARPARCRRPGSAPSRRRRWRRPPARCPPRPRRPSRPRTRRACGRVFHGLRAAPHSSGSVTPFAPNSGVLVLPKIDQPGVEEPLRHQGVLGRRRRRPARGSRWTSGSRRTPGRGP